MNFRDEREHDSLLMDLVRELDRAMQIPLFEGVLGLPPLGRLLNAQRRKAYDVEFTFEQRRLLIETKVDSDEGHRWEAQKDRAKWQTNCMAALAHKGDVCLFITYGFAEFFTKPYEFGAAAETSKVRHVKLDSMVDLLSKAMPVVDNDRTREWLEILRIEQKKRLAMPAVLSQFGKLRRQYLKSRFWDL